MMRCRICRPLVAASRIFRRISASSLLAVSALEQHLVREKKRTAVSVLLESGEPRDVHQMAMLIGFGARAVNPYLAHECVLSLCESGRIDKAPAQAIADYDRALSFGVLKVASKMGVSTLQAYQSAQLFEAVGLDAALVDAYFTNTPHYLGGADLRRIEAVTSYGALAYVNRMEAELKEAADALRVPLFDVSERTVANVRAFKEIQKGAKKAKGIVSEDGVTRLVSQAVPASGGYPVVISRMEIGDAGAMRNVWDVVRARMAAPGAAVFAAEHEGKAVLLAAGTPEAVAAGFDAGAIIRNIAPCVKGGGGGKPAMAQAGGKDPAGIDAALQVAREMLL